jgi:spermidine/putrescine ABC transporter ATP-binding subunit
VSVPGLQLARVSKIFGSSVAVDRLDLDIAEGEFISLLGPSGCGKTTTLMMVAGFEDVSEGSIRIRGRHVENLAPEHRRIGMMFQAYALFPHMNVAANVGYGLKMRGIAKAEREARVKRALAMVHMEAFADRSPRSLSGGQQQRIALARALVVEPDILLLDEPFSALDRELREELQHEVRRLQQELGITTVFVTHDQEEALLMSDRVAVMCAGRVEQCAAPAELYARPATPFVARFIGRGTLTEAAVLEAGANHCRLSCLGREVQVPRPLPVAAQKTANVFFRPEDATLRTSPEGAGAGLSFEARLEAVYFHGASSLAELAIIPSGERAFVDCTALSRHAALTTGETFTVDVPADRIHLVPLKP